MEINVGIDIIEIDRFKKICDKYKERFLEKIFSDVEMKYLKEDIIKMCVGFSFKESIWKALNEEIQKKLNFKDIKIIWKNGKPFLVEKIKNCEILLSYSINKKYIITLLLMICR